MPYYWRPWRYRRRRRFWRRRTGATLRRRRYWRRKRRVRRIKRKLKKINLKQWQPSKIRKLRITGKYPLFAGTRERIGNNNTQSIDNIAPHLYPSGGLFGITVFTLAGLYELHLKARNWWSTTNCNLPLIKYTGCKLTFYRNIDPDYVVVYTRCGALKATEELYRSCQPSLLLLNKHKRVLTCKSKNNKSKISKTVKVPPPALMQNKWYFQKEFARYPLVMILSSACSLDRYYTSADEISTTLGFISINTKIFKYSDFKSPNQTQPYKPNDEYYLGTWTNNTHTSFKEVQVQNFILLGNTKDYQPGTPLGPNKDTWNTYWSSPTKWGNPFYAPYFEPDPKIIVMVKNLEKIKQASATEKLSNIEGVTTLPEDMNLLTYCRYNPQNDRSAHNALYVSAVTNHRTQWGPSSKPELNTQGLPLWLLTFGWHDWLLKSEKIQRLDLDYVYVIISEYITPKLEHYVPVDYNFSVGRSPFETTDHIRPPDKGYWFPKTSYQHDVFSQIINTGPATIKLPPRISVEATMRYTFYFKVGGCPPPMDNVCDPQAQPDFPEPGNLLSPTLLQDPEMPIQYYLQAFDQRRGMLTTKAAKRIKKDYEAEQAILSSTGQTAMDVQLQTPETTSTEDSSEEEKEPQTLQFQLQRHKRRQRKLRHRILQLLKLAKDM